jgi:hypothetical protein
MLGQYANVGIVIPIWVGNSPQLQTVWYPENFGVFQGDPSDHNLI